MTPFLFKEIAYLHRGVEPQFFNISDKFYSNNTGQSERGSGISIQIRSSEIQNLIPSPLLTLTSSGVMRAVLWRLIQRYSEGYWGSTGKDSCPSPWGTRYWLTGVWGCHSVFSRQISKTARRDRIPTLRRAHWKLSSGAGSPAESVRHLNHQTLWCRPFWEEQNVRFFKKSNTGWTLSSKLFTQTGVKYIPQHQACMAPRNDRALHGTR